MRDKAAITMGGLLAVAATVRLLTPRPFAVTGFSTLGPSFQSFFLCFVVALTAFANGALIWTLFGSDVSARTRLGRLSFGSLFGAVGIVTTLLTILVPLSALAVLQGAVAHSNWALGLVMFGVTLMMIAAAELPVVLPYGLVAGLMFAAVAEQTGWWPRRVAT